VAYKAVLGRREVYGMLEGNINCQVVEDASPFDAKRLLAAMSAVQSLTWRALRVAETAGNLSAVASLVRQNRANLEFLSDLSGRVESQASKFGQQSDNDSELRDAREILMAKLGR